MKILFYTVSHVVPSEASEKLPEHRVPAPNPNPCFRGFSSKIHCHFETMASMTDRQTITPRPSGVYIYLNLRIKCPISGTHCYRHDLNP
jgi:hypothetical protein